MFSPTPKNPSQREFVFLIASVMMIVAFAIDAMLPAFPAIGKAYGLSDINQPQLVITALMIGYGFAQFFVGTLADRYGRRGIMIWSLFGYGVMSLLAAIAPSFDMLLAARVAQGAFGAGARVMVTSAVRDRYVGRQMAQVMSLAGVIFMAAPILAPAMGQLILEFAPWRWIFGVLALIGFLLWLWVLFRLPESLDPANAKEISLHQLRTSWVAVFTDRQSNGYSFATACMTGALFGYLMSVQQIFDIVFKAPDFLAWGFAIMAAGMAVASLINSAIVMRFGMRLVGHLGLTVFTVTAGIHMLVTVSGHETLVSFIILQMVMMMGFSFAAANFSAMAMENMGDVAGTASSLQGSFSTIAGALFGTFIGQSFNGTTLPIYLGFFACGCLALAALFVTEGGRLFVARNAPQEI